MPQLAVPVMNRRTEMTEMMDGIAEAGRYWFIWKCIEAGIILAMCGAGVGCVYKIFKSDTGKED